MSLDPQVNTLPMKYMKARQHPAEMSISYQFGAERASIEDLNSSLLHLPRELLKWQKK